MRYKLTKKVDLQQRTGSADTVGERIDLWSTVAATYAEIRPLTSRELFAAAQSHSAVTHAVILRSSTSYATLTSDWRVRYGDKLYHVESAKTLDSDERFVELLCTEGVMAYTELTTTPSCEMFFRCLDTDSVLRDSISGVSLSSGQSLSTGGTLSVTWDATDKTLSTNMTYTSDPVTISGSWPSLPSNTSMMVVFCANVSSNANARIAFGDINASLGGAGYGFGLPIHNMHAAIGKSGGTINKYIQDGLKVLVSSGGAGYTSALTVTHNPGSQGTGATFTPYVVNGALSDIREVTCGYGFGLGSDPAQIGTLSLSETGSPVATWTLAALGCPTLSEYHDGLDIFGVAKYVPGEAAYYRIYDLETGQEYARVNASSGTTGLNVGAVPFDSCMKLSGLKLYGLASFYFTTIPSDWWAATQWMARSWADGNRYLYPAWHST